MASHKGWDYLFPVKSVATSGGSFNLAKGQLGLIDLEGVPTASNGLKLINSLVGLKKDRKLQLRVGKHDIGFNRSQSSKDWSSETFKVSDIVKLAVDAPKEGIKVDKFTLGYNGIDADTAIVLDQGANEEIGINISGEVIGALGYSQAEVEVKLYLDQPNTGALKTMQEIIEGAVEQFNNFKLMGDVPVTNYVKAVAVNSENAALAGTAQAFFTLTLQDEGDSNALAEVQSQYNGYKVIRTDRVGDDSVYTVIDAPATVIADFSKNKAWKVKGCADCPTGYSAFVDGAVYSIGIEDEGIDSTAAIEAISINTEAGSAVQVNVEAGFSTYTVVNTGLLSDAEIAAFLVTYPGAEIGLISANVAEICSPDATVDTAWVEGDTCYTSTETYTLTLADDECGAARLAEVQAAFPELTVALGSQGGCRSKYTTTVITNLVCDECDDIYRDLFTSEAPQDYQGQPWIVTPKTYSATALMGIQFVGQPIEFYGSEVYRDDMPYFATSARIKVAGGAYTNPNESFFSGTTGRFALAIDSIASEPENWGGNLRELEDITRRRQEGVSRHEGNNYAKWILGEETMLKAGVPYVDYILTIRQNSYAQSFSGEKNETFNYHFAVEPGVHVEVEALLNMLAAEAGVQTVQAYANNA